MAKITLTVKNGKLAGKAFEFVGRRRFMIGRGSCCELRLPDEFEFLCVSRNHCLIDMDFPEIRIRDLGSRNGTCVNGMQIGRPQDWHLDAEVADMPSHDYQLHDGNELKVGSTVFRVGVDETEDGDVQETCGNPAELEVGACI